jgi:hypothetical protein
MMLLILVQYSIAMILYAAFMNYDEAFEYEVSMPI